MKYLFLMILVVAGCNTAHQLPKERLSQYQLNNHYEYQADEVKIVLSNPLHCPVRIWVKNNDPILKPQLDQMNPITLAPIQDSLLTIDVSGIQNKEIQFASRLGDVSKNVKLKKIRLPFPKGKKHPLVQGYNSTPTHNTDWSRYALDFGLSIGDTICAATSGYVVGVIEDYKHGGRGKEWKNYGNYTTIYHPESGLFTQYAHLQFKGSFVEVGDRIQEGQAIGLAGMTGQTNIEHLHFNCLQPIHSQDGLISIPMDSIGAYKISEMKRNEVIVH